MSPAVEPVVADGSITLAEAAERLGVHYMTAYRYVRTGRMVATKSGGQWWVDPSDFAAVQAEGTGARRPAKPDGSSGSRELHVDAFMARLVAGDTAGCWDIVCAALNSGAHPTEVHRGLLVPALRAIGVGWRNGTVSVAEEHRATAAVWRLMGQMGPLFRHRGRRRGTIILGAVAGDHHAMPSALMSDLLCDRRFEVIDLGANTPTVSFVGIASEIDDLVGIGLVVTVDEAVQTAIEQTNEIRMLLPDVPLLVGGPSLTSIERSAMTEWVDVVSSSTDDVCEFFEKLADA